jgi:hypothetical protein
VLSVALFSIAARFVSSWGQRWRQKDFVAIVVEYHIGQFLFIAFIVELGFIIVEVIVFESFNFDRIFIVLVRRWHKFFNIRSPSLVIDYHTEIIVFEHAFGFKLFCQIVLG